MKKSIKRWITRFLAARGLALVSTKYHQSLILKAENVPGWFTASECEKLYKLTMITAGSILEIGHFLGRSTACICEALENSQEKRVFKSYDLGFITPDEFKQFYDSLHQRDVPIPPLYDYVFSQKSTTTELASKNLKGLGLEKYVELISGNFIDLDHNLYDFIFCDAMHEQHEIETNLPFVIRNSVQHCIWAFHDMNDLNIDWVLKLSNSKFIERTHSLAVFLYLGSEQT
jgi:hypothetical protein